MKLREWRPSGVQFGSAVAVLLLNWAALGRTIAPLTDPGPANPGPANPGPIGTAEVDRRLVRWPRPAGGK